MVEEDWSLTGKSSPVLFHKEPNKNEENKRLIAICRASLEAIEHIARRQQNMTVGW